MKLSISLSEEDLAILDRYTEAAGLPSRSATIQKAIRMLGDPDLEDAYSEAWEEWHTSGDAAEWEHTAADGLTDATR